MWYLSEQKVSIFSALPGAWNANWLQGKSIISKPLSLFLVHVFEALGLRCEAALGRSVYDQEDLALKL